jgi:peptidoglycan/xylan/chitin deacetylase (PgdA/CDA1 family)
MTSTKKRLTLTFDNGPDAQVTPQVLEELARRRLKATFFVLGKNMAEPSLRAIAERVHAEGHWIGNHTFTHEVPLGDRTDPGAAQDEIGATQKLIGDLTHPDKLFRPFGNGGHLSNRLLNAECQEYLVSGGYTCVLWNSIPRDWEDVDGWVDRALGHLDELKWTVIVLHDLATGAIDNLGRFLDVVAERDIEIVQEFPNDCVIIKAGQSNLDSVLAKRVGL